MFKRGFLVFHVIHSSSSLIITQVVVVLYRLMALNKEAESDWILVQRQRAAVTTYHNRKESGLLVREPLNETCLP